MIGGTNYSDFLAEVRDNDNEPLTAGDVAEIGRIVNNTLAAGEGEDGEDTD